MNKGEPKIFDFDPKKGEEIFQKTKNKIEVISSLDEFLKTEDEEKVREILKNRSVCEQAIYSRGEQGNDYLDLLEKSFAFLLAKEFGQEKDIFSVSGNEMIKWLQETGLPEYVLIYLLEAAFHQNNENKFLKFLSLILSHAEEIKDKSVVLRAEHDLASWQSSKSENKEKAFLLNKRIIKNSSIIDLRGEIDKKDLANIIEKARFGLTYNKELKPKDLIKGYNKLTISLRELHNLQDATRALNEKAFAYLNLAKRQTGKSQSDLKEKNLFLAKDTALAALKYAINFNYINAEIKARKALVAVYKELGNKKKEKSYSKKAKELEEKYNYKF